MKLKLFSMAVALMLSFNAGAAPAGQPVPAPGSENIMPFTPVSPSVVEDAGTVRLYFLYTCPYCRTAHRQLVRWGETLPSQFEFRESPVVGVSKDTITPAFGYYAMKQAAPAKLTQYNEIVYAEIQDRHRSPSDPKIYMEAAKRVGLTEKAFAKAWASETTRNLVAAAANLTARYRLIATPSLAVAGRMVVTPEMTGGVNDAFFNLVNAVSSKALIEQAGGKL